MKDAKRSVFLTLLAPFKPKQDLHRKLPSLAGWGKGFPKAFLFSSFLPTLQVNETKGQQVFSAVESPRL